MRFVSSVRIDAFEVAIGGARVRAVEPDAARVVRRLAFDAALAAVARARGVVVRELRLSGVLRRDDGLELACEDGRERRLTISTRVLVGADGVTGITRRLAGFPRHGALRAQAIEVDTPRVASDAASDTLRFSFLPQLRGYVWDFPTPLDGKIMISRGAYLLRDRREADDDPVRAHLARHLAEHDLSLADFQPRQLAEQGFAPHAQLATPRILLVGEAAGIDFPTGEGIAQAIAYGAVAAPYLAHALRHDRLGFGDWPRTWLASEEGRFLRRRALGGRVLFGAQRERIERALGASPAVFSLVLRRFAGRPTTRLATARALYELGRAGLGDALGDYIA